MELTMTAPLSQDLRGRIVRCVAAGTSARAAAQRFEVCASAAIKLVQRVLETGSTAPAKIGGYRRPILEPHADTLREIAKSKPGITLKEMREALHERGISVKALSTIADMLHRLKVSYKKSLESRRAGSARCGPAPPPLAGVAGLHGVDQPGVSGRERRVDQHDAALRLGSEGRAPGRRRPAWACVDAPSGARRISEQVAARDRVLPCVRPRMRHGMAACPYGSRGSGPHHWNALEALPVRLVLLTPPHRRCAIPVLRPPHTLDSLPPALCLRSDGRSSIGAALR